MDSSFREGPPVLVRESSLARIEILAKNQLELVFTSLAHRIDLHLLRESFKQVRKSKSAGVDEVTAKDYAEYLDENLYNLYERLRRGQYVATPVKRIWIDKEDGKKRPIGIPALEDKIVQKAVNTILYVVYDIKFYDFSHGFRKGHSQHMALHEIRENIRKLNINWIVDADVSGFFDNIDHSLLGEMIKQRVNDGGILRLIGKWLKAGVMDEGNLTHPEKGTPQGGVISPMLGNIYLHYVLDEWYVNEVKPRLKKRSFLVRYADDFIIGCESEEDARRVKEILKKRFGRFKLAIHPEKTKLVEFRRPVSWDKKADEIGTFNFLGFTHYWAKTRRGYWVMKVKTEKGKVRRFLTTLWKWIRKNRHRPIAEQHRKLKEKLQGYYQYYAVSYNSKTLDTIWHHVAQYWKYWLSRRNHKNKMNWDKFTESILGKYPLPRPRIIHKYI